MLTACPEPLKIMSVGSNTKDILILFKKWCIHIAEWIFMSLEWCYVTSLNTVTNPGKGEVLLYSNYQEDSIDSFKEEFNTILYQDVKVLH